MNSKIKQLIVILLVAVGMFSLTASTVSAQYSRCPNPTTGCVVCVYSDGTGQCETSNAPDGTLASSCAPGYEPPSTDLFSYCRSIVCDLNAPSFIACKPILTKNNCVTDATGSKSCQVCDDIVGNAITDCNSTATTAALCKTNCVGPSTTDPQACTNFKATCKESCATDETPIAGTCAVGSNKCCIPNSLLGSPGTGTKQMTKVETCDALAGGKGVDTAIGCIPIENITALTTFVMRWLLGIGGGIAFLMILFAGFQIMTSSGDPKKLSSGQELLTSAVSGLILVIFSIFILRLIGVNILGIF